MTRYILFFVTILLGVSLVTSLSCYACDKNSCKSRSFVKMDCSAQTGNPFVDTVKSGIPLLCAKIEGIDGNGKPFEERNCTANLGPSSCSLLVNSISIMEKAKSVQCHTCDSDYCNSGTTLFATFGLLLSTVFFFV